MRRGNVRAATVAVAAAALVLMYAWRVAPRWLEVVRLRVALPGLPSGWVGPRIAHLSDFHAGNPGVPLTMLHEARRVALDFRPDLIALTGDFYDNGQVVDSGGLFGDWPEGTVVVAVLGNHDFRGGASALDQLLRELTEAGVQVLRNETVRVALAGRDAWIVGVDDPFTWRADEERAFDALPPDEEALLYLAHSPAAITSMPVGRARLLLSGHTHGGQLRLLPSGRIPLVRQIRRLLGSPERRDPPVHRGIHWLRGAVLVISNGLGVSRLPLRFRTRPQVILIELAQARPDGPPCDDVRRYVEFLGRPPVWLRWLA